MVCPRDHQPLTAVEVPGGRSWACPACCGQFVERAHVDVVLAATPPDPTPAAWEKPAYLPCPSCGKGTRRHNYLRVSGVLVDDCPWCGTWFDAGELGRIAAFLAAGGAERGAAREAELEDERRRSAANLAKLEAKTRDVERAARRFSRFRGF